jgi:hypothetical protein
MLLLIPAIRIQGEKIELLAWSQSFGYWWCILYW